MRPLGRALFALALAACNDGGKGGATARFDLHQSATRVNVPTLTSDFYTLPYPNALRLEADGTVDLSTYPRLDGLLGDYVDTFDRSTFGFGEAEGIFFRFDAPLDPATLPKDAAASVAGDATAYVVDVTPGSPTYGQKRPLLTRFVAQSYDFIGPNWLALVPFPGIPLREKTTYAVILTDGIHAADGGPLERDPDFAALMSKSGDAKVMAAVSAHQPLFDWLDSHSGLAAHVVCATVYTTSDATSIMAKLRKAVYDQAPAPTLTGLVDDGEDLAGVDHVYSGSYMGPNFQQGDPPYAMRGGDLMLDASGNPLLVRMEPIRVAMTIPEAQMPAAGWPVVIYAHGTGGDYKSFIRDGSGREVAKITDRAGAPITEMAMISIDQVLHGPRAPAGTNVDLNFFNLNNIAAARSNVKQGALDDFQLLRLVEALDTTAPGNVHIKFDPSKIYFKGHSQGGLTGPLFLAVEPKVKAAVLSGAGADLTLSLLHKLKPINIPNLLGALLHDPVDEFHPLINLTQSFFESSDPGNYGRLFFREPPAGQAPKPIFQSLGIVDSYTPIPNLKALALSMGVQPIQPMLEPIDGLDLAGLAWGEVPVMQNVSGVTGVLFQYKATGADGHFVVFDVPAAIAQSNRFLGTHSVSGIAKVDAP